MQEFIFSFEDVFNFISSNSFFFIFFSVWIFVSLTSWFFRVFGLVRTSKRSEKQKFTEKDIE